MLLSKLEETLLIDGQPFDLSSNRYPGVVHPQGFRYLMSFRLDPFPIFTYEVEGIVIEKTVFMVYGENTTVVQYELKSTKRSQPPKSLRLEIRPLIAFRDYHCPTHANGALNAAVEQEPGLASRDALPRTADFIPGPQRHGIAEGRATGTEISNTISSVSEVWISRKTFSIISSCALICFESPGLDHRVHSTRAMSREPASIGRPRSSAAGLRCRPFPVNDEFAQALTAASDQYIVARGNAEDRHRRLSLVQ